MSQVKSKDLRKVSKNFVHQKWFDLLSLSILKPPLHKYCTSLHSMWLLIQILLAST